MLSHICLKFSDFHTFQGRIGRLDFLLGLVLTGSVPTILYYLFRNQVLALGNNAFYFGFKTLLQLLEPKYAIGNLPGAGDAQIHRKVPGLSPGRPPLPKYLDV